MTDDAPEADSPAEKPAAPDHASGEGEPAQSLEQLTRKVQRLEASERDLREQVNGLVALSRRSTQRALLFRLLILAALLAAFFLMRQRSFM
jgi:hypothetical protein